MNIESLKELLKHLPTCDHITYGLDSFDYARGDHLCSGKALYERETSEKRFGYPVKKKFCEYHKEKGDKPLPWTVAYKALKKMIDAKSKKSKG